MCYSFFLFTYAHSLWFPRWNFNRSFEFPLELFSELSAVWKLWSGKRIDPLPWPSLVPMGSGSACAHLGWQRAALGRERPLPGFVPGSLDSHMKGVWGPHPALSVFLLGCFSPDAKGTNSSCRFPSFSLCSQRCFGFPEAQHLHSSTTLRCLKFYGFLDIFSTFSKFSTFIYGSFFSGKYFYLSSHFPKSSQGPYSCLHLLPSRVAFQHLLHDQDSQRIVVYPSEAICWSAAPNPSFSLPQNLILRGLNMSSCENVAFMLTWRVCIPVCICLATFKCIIQLQLNLREGSSLKNSKFPQGLSREVEERCPTSTEEKAAMLCWAFVWCQWIHLGGSSHLSIPPAGRIASSAHTFSGAQVNQAQGKQIS